MAAEVAGRASVHGGALRCGLPDLEPGVDRRVVHAGPSPRADLTQREQVEAPPSRPRDESDRRVAAVGSAPTWRSRPIVLRQRDAPGNPLTDELHQGPAPGVLLPLDQEPSPNRFALERVAVHVFGQLFQPADLVADEQLADRCAWVARERHLGVREAQALGLVAIVPAVARVEASEGLRDVRTLDLLEHLARRAACSRREECSEPRGDVRCRLVADTQQLTGGRLDQENVARAHPLRRGDLSELPAVGRAEPAGCRELALREPAGGELVLPLREEPEYRVTLGCADGTGPCSRGRAFHGRRVSEPARDDRSFNRLSIERARIAWALSRRLPAVCPGSARPPDCSRDRSSWPLGTRAISRSRIATRNVRPCSFARNVASDASSSARPLSWRAGASCRSVAASA